MKPSWMELWVHVEGMVANGQGHFLVAVLPILFTLFLMILPLGALAQFIDRKIGADLQARVGPSLSGVNGLFQPLVDVLKLLQKESKQKLSRGARIWLLFHTAVTFSTIAVLPMSRQSLLVDTELSALLPFWSGIVLAMGMIMTGLEGNDVPGRLGGVRVAAQALTAVVPSLVALMAAAVNAGGFGWSQLADRQDFSPHHWAVVSNPFLFLALLVFLSAGTVINSIPPMDGGLFQTDVHFGLGRNISGTRFVLYEITRFYGFFLWSVIAVACFLGAWRLPNWLYSVISSGGNSTDISGSWPIFLIESVWTLMKASVVMLLMRVIARTTARLRIDHITSYCWRILTPLSFLALAGATLWTMGREFL